MLDFIASRQKEKQMMACIRSVRRLKLGAAREKKCSKEISLAATNTLGVKYLTR
jgi:hypothetical protein